MKITIVSECFDINSNSTGYYWGKMALSINTRFDDVNIVSSAIQCEALNIQASKKIKATIIASRSYNKNNLLSRLLAQLRLSYSLAKASVNNSSRGDIIFCGTNPPFLVVILAFYRLFYNFNLCVLVHDLFPHNLVPAGLLVQSNPIFILVRSIFAFAFRNTDALIVIGRDMYAPLERMGVKRSRINYVPNWVDIDVVKIRIAKEKLENKDRTKLIVFKYFGNIGRVQDLITVVRAFSTFGSRDIRLVIVGDGVKRKEIEQYINNHTYFDIEIKNSVPFKDNDQELFDCDVAVVPLAAGMKGLAVPSKAYFSMSAGKWLLVIGDYGSELDLMLEANKDVGEFCVSNDINSIRQKIEKIRTYIRSGRDCNSQAAVYESYRYDLSMVKIGDVLASFIIGNK